MALFNFSEGRFDVPLTLDGFVVQMSQRLYVYHPPVFFDTEPIHISKREQHPCTCCITKRSNLVPIVDDG